MGVWYSKAQVDALLATKAPLGSGSSSGGPAPDVYLSTIGTATANTSSINTALTNLYNAGGGVLRLAAGTWDHNGIVMPPGGKVSLLGAGQDATLLRNNSTSAASVSVIGASAGTNPSRPYASGWRLADLAITSTAATVNAGQVGVDVGLAVQYEIRNIRVSHHDTGFRFNSVWETSHIALTAIDCGAYGYHYVTGFAGSTPTTFFSCNAISSTGAGLYVEGDVNVLAWHGGDFVGNSMGVSIQASTARLISFYGLNFEGQTGTTDVQVGNSTTSVGPGTVNFYGCRFFRGGAKGTHGIDFQVGAQVNVSGCYFGNFTNAMHQSNLTALMRWEGIVCDNTTNFVNSQSMGVFNRGSGEIAPSGVITNDAYSGFASSVGLGVKPGDRALRIGYGYVLANTTGVDGDLFINTQGTTGARFYIRTAGVWTAIPGI